MRSFPSTSVTLSEYQEAEIQMALAGVLGDPVIERVFCCCWAKEPELDRQQRPSWAHMYTYDMAIREGFGITSQLAIIMASVDLQKLFGDEIFFLWEDTFLTYLEDTDERVSIDGEAQQRTSFFLRDTQTPSGSEQSICRLFRYSIGYTKVFFSECQPGIFKQKEKTVRQTHSQPISDERKAHVDVKKRKFELAVRVLEKYQIVPVGRLLENDHSYLVWRF